MLGGLDMNNLKIGENLTKKIKQGISFALVGTMLVGAAVRTAETSKNRDNNRYHELHQTINTQQLQVSQGINLYLNDHVFIPRDVNGNEVSPFVYNGTTYVPIRAITTALGADVNYANNVASITRTSGAKVNPGIDFREDISLTSTTLSAITNISVEVDSKPFIPRDVNGNLVNIYAVNGTIYVPLRALCDAYNIPVVWDGENNRIYLGTHINLVDPNIWSSQNDKNMQRDYNLASISFEQIKMDTKILHQQFAKFESFVNTLVNTYPTVTGTYHDELEQLHSEVANDYLTLLEGNHRFDDEYIAQEIEFLSTIMNYKEEINPVISNLDRIAKEIVAKELAELNALCTDERIEQLYDKLNDIVRRYQSNFEKDKTLIYKP